MRYSYKEIAEKLTKCQAIAVWLMMTQDGEPITGAELNCLASNPHCHKDLARLARWGVVERCPKRVCDISGRPAWTWKLTYQKPVFMAETKRMTRRELEDENTRLKTELERIKNNVDAHMKYAAF